MIRLLRWTMVALIAQDALAVAIAMIAGEQRLAATFAISAVVAFATLCGAAAFERRLDRFEARWREDEL